MSEHAPQLYERAELYDLIYSDKAYDRESARLVDHLHELGVPRGGSVLEGCCGTGNYLVHLQEHFDARGFDIAPEMLALARTKGVTVAPGDMRLFTVDEPVDAFLCLFSSIGYLEPSDLPAVAARIEAALKPGGVALIEPWLTPDAVKDGHFMLQQATSDEVVAARASAVTLEGAVSHVDFAWSIARPHRVETFEERHSLHVLSRADLAAPFVAAGLEASWEDRHIVMRRGLLMLRKA